MARIGQQLSMALAEGPPETGSTYKRNSLLSEHIIHSFTYSFIHPAFIKHLRYAGSVGVSEEHRKGMGCPLSDYGHRLL